MKKSLMIVAVFLLSLGLLAGCSGKEDNNGSTAAKEPSRGVWDGNTYTNTYA